MTSPPSVISAASLFTSERGGLNIPDFTAVRWCTEHGGSHGAPCLTFEVKSFTNALDRALRVRDFVFRVRSAASRLRGESEKAAVETEAQVANEIDATLVSLAKGACANSGAELTNHRNGTMRRKRSTL